MWLLGCLNSLPIDLDKFILISASIILATITFLILKTFKLSTKSKVALIYGHIMFLLFPIVLFTTNATCGIACAFCQNNMIALLMLSLPTTFAATTIASLFVIPGIYVLYNKKALLENKNILNFIKNHSKRLKIQEPKTYVVDSAKPTAFSFKSIRSAIFLSAGLLDILKKKELEAVILHELGHIKRSSSLLTSSLNILKIFTPFSFVYGFNHDKYKEERCADQYAIAHQKTNKHLKSAKKKMHEFEKF